MARTDDDVIRLYREWSEEFYAAGFMTPTEEGVRAFRGWLKKPSEWVLGEGRADYEQEMLDIYWRQEKEASQ